MAVALFQLKVSAPAGAASAPATVGGGDAEKKSPLSRGLFWWS